MKIFCVGRNYVAHALELNNEVPTSPVIFMKPETAQTTKGEFYYPDFSSNIQFEGELVVKICKNGKKIQKEFAHNYYNQISLGIDFTARDIQSDLKSKGLPWEIAKGFDNSAPTGMFLSKEEFHGSDEKYEIFLNGKLKQEGDTQLMIFNIDELISYISNYFTLKRGDLIFTGTPSGVGPVKIGDIITGKLCGKEVLKCTVK